MASREAAEYREFYKTEGFKLALLEARDNGCWLMVETPDEERFPVHPEDVEYEAGGILYRDDIGRHVPLPYALVARWELVPAPPFLAV